MLTGLTPNTLYHFRARSRNGAGNLGVSVDGIFTTAAVPPDVTPPIVRAVVSSDITATSTTITWLTNENSDSQVEFGPTTTYGRTSPQNPMLFTNHLVTLTDLVPGTLHHYRVKSKDAAGNQTVSNDFTFTTLAGSGASVAQSVVWTNIVKATLSGTTLRKTAGCDGCESTAISQQMITAGSGYLEVPAYNANKEGRVGLMYVGRKVSSANIDYAVGVCTNGSISVRERGIYRMDTTCQTGDKFRIAIENGAVNYYKNGAVIYKSRVAPTYPLIAVEALFNIDASISNVVIDAGPTVIVSAPRK